MKRYLTLIFGFVIFSSLYAQNTFEGIIKFKTEIKGKNPVMEGMMPDSFIFLFKNKDVRIILSGGILSAMMGDIVSKGDSNISFMLDYTNKTAYRYDPYKFGKSASIDVDETDKKQKILDKNCKLFKISNSTKDGYITTDLWTTDELPILMPTNNPITKNFVFAGIEGFPLLVESKITYQATEFDIIIKAVRIIERPIPANEFMIPEDFKIVPLLTTSESGF